MLQVELANEHLAVEKIHADILVFRKHCCLEVLRIGWILEIFWVSKSGSMYWSQQGEGEDEFCVFPCKACRAIQLLVKYWDFFQGVDKLVPQNCWAEGDRPWLLVCHSNMTLSIPLCWKDVWKKKSWVKYDIFIIFMCWPSWILKVPFN